MYNTLELIFFKEVRYFILLDEISKCQKNFSLSSNNLVIINI